MIKFICLLYYENEERTSHIIFVTIDLFTVYVFTWSCYNVTYITFIITPDFDHRLPTLQHPLVSLVLFPTIPGQ